MVLLRRLIGGALRRARLRQSRTLREVSAAARVSLGYLSEVERGQKEASSELLAAICQALGVRMSDLLREVSDGLALVEPTERGSGLPANAVVPSLDRPQAVPDYVEEPLPPARLGSDRPPIDAEVSAAA